MRPSPPRFVWQRGRWTWADRRSGPGR
ncbi:MAG: hypothetical protein ACLQAH_12530 [Limisphaerales bacterium]